MKQPFALTEKMAQLSAIEEYFRTPDIDLEAAIEKHKEALELSKEILTYLDTVESTFKTLELPTVEV